MFHGDENHVYRMPSVQGGLSIGDERFSFKWPRPGTEFDARLMDREGIHHIGAARASTIHLTLYPTLIAIDRGDRVIWRALVLS